MEITIQLLHPIISWRTLEKHDNSCFGSFMPTALQLGPDMAPFCKNILQDRARENCQFFWSKVRPKIRGTLYVFIRHIWDNCWIVIIYISLESSSWTEYKYAEIFQQFFVVIKSREEDEKCALLSQGT